MLRFFLLLLLLSTPALAVTDFKIRTVSHSHQENSPIPDFQNEETVYVQGASHRKDLIAFVGTGPANPHARAPHMAVISHCDTHKWYAVDVDTHEYVESKLSGYPSEEEFGKKVEAAKKKAAERPVEPPNLRIESDTVDTGETRTVFGHTARHFITTVREIPLAGLPSEEQERVEDGWYLDIPSPSASCVPDYINHHGNAVQVRTVLAAGSNPGDIGKSIRAEAHHTGPTVEGMPVKLTIRTKIKMSGKEVESFYETEVVELSEQSLDPSLFEPPAGFKKVSKLYQHQK